MSQVTSTLDHHQSSNQRFYPTTPPPNQAFFVIRGGEGGGEILEEAGTFSGQALLLSYPYPGGGGSSQGGRHPLTALVHSTYFESIPSKNLSLALALKLAPGFEPTACTRLVQCSTARVLTRSRYLLQNKNFAYKYCPPKRPTHSWPTPTQGGGRVFPLRAPRISKKAGRHPPPGGGCARH